MDLDRELLSKNIQAIKYFASKGLEDEWMYVNRSKELLALLQTRELLEKRIENRSNYGDL